MLYARVRFAAIFIALLFILSMPAGAQEMKLRVVDYASLIVKPDFSDEEVYTPDTPRPNVAAPLPEAAEAPEYIKAELTRIAEKGADPWITAVASRVIGAEITAESVTIKLMSFDSGAATNATFEGGATTYLSEVLINAVAPFSVTLEVKDGALIKPSALETAIKNAANAARKSFDYKVVRLALVEAVMPPPIEIPAKAPDALNRDAFTEDYLRFESGIAALVPAKNIAAFLPALTYGYKKQTLSVSGGPSELKLKYSAPDLPELLDKALSAAKDEVRFLSYAGAYTNGMYAAILAKHLSAQTIAFQHGGASGRSDTLNIDFLSCAEAGYPSASAEMISDSLTLCNQATQALADFATDLPDLPEQPLPTTGVLSGENIGTQIDFLADDQPLYIRAYAPGTDAYALAAFVRAGETLSAHLPQGTYTLFIARGQVWYGEEGMFGANGAYMEANDVAITQVQYLHTLSIRP